MNANVTRKDRLALLLAMMTWTVICGLLAGAASLGMIQEGHGDQIPVMLMVLAVPYALGLALTVVIQREGQGR